MTINWSGFDKVIYINQKERNDRKYRIEKELHALGIPSHKIHRLNATHHLISPIGDALSHLQAIETAMHESWGNVLILEDDMVFNKDLDSIKHLNCFMQMLQGINWHCALFSAVYQKVIPLKSTDKIVRPLEAKSACAYAVHSDYQVTMRNCFADAVEKMRKGGSIDEHTIDIAWLPFMQNHYWVGMYPVAGHKGAGQLSSEKSAINIRENYYKPLAAIAV